jgi:pyruvate,water dikinase
LVEAEALVVDSPDISLPVKGKILVARMTDPGWVFLMVSAAGLIVERGSLLSHTAIIGRELGIPTIVGVADACRLISTGSRIRMDGATGHITTGC